METENPSQNIMHVLMETLKNLASKLATTLKSQLADSDVVIAGFALEDGIKKSPANDALFLLQFFYFIHAPLLIQGLQVCPPRSRRVDQDVTSDIASKPGGLLICICGRYCWSGGASYQSSMSLPFLVLFCTWWKSC